MGQKVQGWKLRTGQGKKGKEKESYSTFLPFFLQLNKTLDARFKEIYSILWIITFDFL